jgi:hypothetical protein
VVFASRITPDGHCAKWLVLAMGSGWPAVVGWLVVEEVDNDWHAYERLNDAGLQGTWNCTK